MSENSGKRTDMTHNERIVFEMIVTAARAGLSMPSNDAIKNTLGRASLSTASVTVSSLESKGHIIVKRFVNERQVEVPSMQIQTRGPKSNSPPRASTLPTPSIAMLSGEDPNLAGTLRREAFTRKMELQDFLILLVQKGWDAIQAKT